MIQDTGVVLWKELREFFAGGGRGRAVMLITPLVFGVLLPALNKSSDWGTSSTPLVLYGLYLPVIMILSVAADTFAGERERHTLETLLASRLPDQAILYGKLAAIIIFGWGQGVVTSLVALVVVNIIHPGQGVILYSAPVWGGIFGLGLVMSALGASAATLVSLRTSTVRQAQQILSVALLVILFGTGIIFGALPQALRQQAAAFIAQLTPQALLVDFALVILVIDVILIAVARALFQRSRLMLTSH
jgi:ABC-2 type transport system permease protein